VLPVKVGLVVDGAVKRQGRHHRRLHAASVQHLGSTERRALRVNDIIVTGGEARQLYISIQKQGRL